jgi:VWFA-related protein
MSVRRIVPHIVAALFVVATISHPVRAQVVKSPAAQSQDDAEIETVETNLATVLLTATDRKGRLFNTLKAEDVRVFEDGAEQRVTVFERQTERPLSLALVFDTSGSQARSLPDQKLAARLFLRSIFRPDRDRAAIVSFAGGAILLQSFTSDLARLEEAVERVGTPQTRPLNIEIDPALARAPSGGTAIYDALFLTCYKVLTKAAPNTRRAVILLTDGMDNESRLRPRDAVNSAVYANAVVYGIGVGYTVDGGSLQSVTDETAGRAFFPTDDEELRAAFARIEQELRSQYLIAYTPTNKAHDGKRRDVRVEITNAGVAKEKVRLSYRRYYYVKKSAAPKSATH